MDEKSSEAFFEFLQTTGVGREATVEKAQSERASVGRKRSSPGASAATAVSEAHKQGYVTYTIKDCARQEFNVYIIVPRRTDSDFRSRHCTRLTPNLPHSILPPHIPYHESNQSSLIAAQLTTSFRYPFFRAQHMHDQGAARLQAANK